MREVNRVSVSEGSPLNPRYRTQDKNSYDLEEGYSTRGPIAHYLGKGSNVVRSTYHRANELMDNQEYY